jgi:hypothetical protein
MQNAPSKDLRADFTNVVDNAARFRACQRTIARGNTFSAIH